MLVFFLCTNDYCYSLFFFLKIDFAIPIDFIVFKWDIFDVMEQSVDDVCCVGKGSDILVEIFHRL